MKTEEIEQLKESSIGHALIKAARLFNEFAFQNAKEHFEMDNLKPSHLKLFAFIPFEGITINELANKVDISKQAVSVLVKDLLASKVLIKKENLKDKRSFLILFNTKGKKGLLEGMKYLKGLDKDIVSLLGVKESNKMHKSLLTIINNLDQK